MREVDHRFHSWVARIIATHAHTWIGIALALVLGSVLPTGIDAQDMARKEVGALPLTLTERGRVFDASGRQEDKQRIEEVLNTPTVMASTRNLDAKGLRLDATAMYGMDFSGRRLLFGPLSNRDARYVDLVGGDLVAHFLVLSNAGLGIQVDATVGSASKDLKSLVFRDLGSQQGLELNYSERKSYQLGSPRDPSSFAGTAFTGLPGCIVSALGDLAKPCEAALLALDFGVCVAGIAALPVTAGVSAVLAIPACVSAAATIVQAVACAGIDCTIFYSTRSSVGIPFSPNPVPIRVAGQEMARKEVGALPLTLTERGRVFGASDRQDSTYRMEDRRRIDDVLNTPTVIASTRSLDAKGLRIDATTMYGMDFSGRRLLFGPLSHDARYIDLIGSDLVAHFVVLSNAGLGIQVDATVDSASKDLKSLVFRDLGSQQGLELNYSERKSYQLGSPRHPSSFAGAASTGLPGCIVSALGDLAKPCEAALLGFDFGLCVGSIAALPATATASVILAIPACASAAATIVQAMACSGIDCTAAAAPGVPGVPQSVTGSASGNTITVSWQPPQTGSPITNYVVRAGTAPGVYNSFNGSVGTGTAVSGVVASGTYYIAVAAQNATGVGPASSEIRVVVGVATPTPTPTPTPVTPFVINYEAAVSSADRATIDAALPMCRTFFQSQFGRTTTSTVTVTVKTDRTGVDSASGHAISVSTLNESWLVIGPAQRTKIICHELFHVLQFETGWSSNAWLLEGSAEYVGYAAIVNNGMASYAEVKACQTDNYFGAGGASIVPLEQISYPSTRGGYLVGWHALDKLLGGVGGLSTLARYSQAGTWPQAFSAVFGFSPETFYSDFSQYRTTLRSTGTMSCAALNNR